jgi:hemolysin activation/secretion protein
VARGALALRCAAALAAVLAALLAPAAAFAQAQPPTPGTVLETVPARPARPSGPAQLLFPREEERRPAAGGPRFTVYGFEFTGNTLFSEARLRRLVERYVDLELNLFELNSAADAVTRFYRQQGYPVARAIVPAQRVTDGVVRIEVVEGHIGAVRFEGNRRYSGATLAARTEPLSTGGVVTMDRLERSLLLLNDLPGLTARATLEPGSAFGTTDALIKVEEKPVDVALQLSNTGRREVGTTRLDAGASLNNPLGIGDQLTVREVRSEGGLFEYRRLGYSLPLNASGLRFSAARSTVEYRVAGDFEALGIRGSVRGSELGLSYPLVRGRSRNIIGSIGERYVNSAQSALGTPVSQGSLQVATASVNASWLHKDSSASTLSASYSGNGRSNPGPVVRPDALTAQYNVEYTYLTGVSPHWDMFQRGGLVKTKGAAPDTEKFGLGGPDSVRAYRSAELRGDNGWLLVTELRRQLVIAEIPAVASLFYDWGGVNNQGFAGQDKLQGVGAGLAAYPSRNVRVQAQLATPFQSRTPADGKRTHAWLSISAQF